MENELKKLMDFYKCEFKELADKLGISLKQLYNVRNGVNTGRFLKEKILNLVQKIESL